MGGNFYGEYKVGFSYEQRCMQLYRCGGVPCASPLMRMWSLCRMTAQLWEANATSSLSHSHSSVKGPTRVSSFARSAGIFEAP